ncbi:MAG: N-6 DNA methylase [Polyangiales bacterium]
MTTQLSLPTDSRRQEVQTIIKNASDEMRADGVDQRDYVEQLAWLFFLKVFDATEGDRADQAAFDEGDYVRRLDGEFRWSSWSKLPADAMLRFVNNRLWPNLQNKDRERSRTDAVSERLARIFGQVDNHCRDATRFKRVVEQVDLLRFDQQTDVIVLSELYENLLKQVAADSAGWAGEFYTQRHIIRAMVAVVDPKLGERVYDPCFGSAGFLAEAAEHMRRARKTMSADEWRRFSEESFAGVELKGRAFLLGNMNLMLHGVHGAKLEIGNALERHTANVPEAQKYNVILANPPYGGKLADNVQTNFTIASGSSEVLFLQHIMANLAKGGRAGVVVPEGVLFRSGPDQKVRERLLEEFDLHTVLSLPAGCFLPYTGVKTDVLFFDRRADGATTSKVWFYELTNDGFELKGTRKPIAGEQLTDFVATQKTKADGERSWSVAVEELEKKGWDLTARNPNRKREVDGRSAAEIVRSMREKEERILVLLTEIEGMLEGEG